MNASNSKVEWYFTQDDQWVEAFKKLRQIALASGLTEELKWGHPCYSLEGKNVFLMHGFKDYCALLFIKGALMKDPDNILIQQTENVQSARQIRFTSTAQIDEMKVTLKAYIVEAIEVEKSGKKVNMKKTTEFAMPDEFGSRLDNDKSLREAFYALTPGRQRAYLLHFSSAKQSATREARINKCTPMILDGLGLND